MEMIIFIGLNQCVFEQKTCYLIGDTKVSDFKDMSWAT